MAKLSYILDSEPGYERVRKGRGFAYYLDGSLVRDKKTLDRFKALVIPPAWKDVWICTKENGHLQVTGVDEKGRKQYLYHDEWRRLQQENKFSRIIDFGKALPRLRKQIRTDTRKRKLTKEKVVALALELMEHTLIRAGNTRYRDLHKSYGLTTLTNKHVHIKGAEIRFKFKGKKGVLQDITIRDRRLSKQLQDVKEIPGQYLFQFVDENDEVCTVDSADINYYIQTCLQDDFSSKDFRTWFGTVWAFIKLVEMAPFENETECKKNVAEMYDFVALKLGNTRSVCKKYYVCDSLIEVYKNGLPENYRKKLSSQQDQSLRLEKAEKLVLKLLECPSSKKAQPA